MKYWENPEAILSKFRQWLPNSFRWVPVAIPSPSMATSSHHTNRYNFAKNTIINICQVKSHTTSLPYLLLPKNHPKVQWLKTVICYFSQFCRWAGLSWVDMLFHTVSAGVCWSHRVTEASGGLPEADPPTMAPSDSRPLAWVAGPARDSGLSSQQGI